MFKRQKTDVKVLSLQADLQEQRLTDIQKSAKAWKFQAFGRPESLILAFLAGFAVAGKADDSQSGSSSGGKTAGSHGKGRVLKALEAAFLAWRLVGKPIAETSASAAAGTAD